MNTSAVRCVQVLASIADSASGPSYSVVRLSEALQQVGVPVELFTVSGWRTTADGASRGAFNGAMSFAQDLTAIPGLKQLCLSHGMNAALKPHAGAGDVLHTHGLWLMPNVYPAWASRTARCPLVVSPRGMLGPEALRFSRWKKMAFWHVLQRSAVAAAGCLHATSEQEYQEIRAFGLRNPVAVIPNGIDLPDIGTEAALGNPDRTVLSLGRIHPKKGLDRLVQAWSAAEREFPDWRLRIVGPDEGGYGEALKAQATNLRLSRISFEPALYGDAKVAALHKADLFVLPSLNENFGMVVAEALAAGTPVISTKGTPWSEVEAHSCGWWVESEPEALAAAMAKAMRMPRPDLEAMGAKGRSWMMQEFSWRRVAEDMANVYRWLAGMNQYPAVVRPS